MAKKGWVNTNTWESIFAIAYLVVGTNAMLLLATAPLLILLTTTDPQSSWPALAFTAFLATPGVGAAFAVFRRFSLTRNTDVVRSFWAAWARHLRRSLALGAFGVGGAVVLSVDIAALMNGRLGALVIPFLVICLALVGGTTILALVASVERPQARLRDVLKASVYLCVRRWYLTIVSFIAIGTLAALFMQSPALAFGVAAAPLLYGVWGNSRHSLRPVLPAGSAIQL